MPGPENKTTNLKHFSQEEQDLIDSFVRESDRAKSEEKEALGVELPRPEAVSGDVKIPRHLLPPNFDKNLAELKATMNKMDKRLKPVRASNSKSQAVLASAESRTLGTIPESSKSLAEDIRDLGRGMSSLGKKFDDASSSPAESLGPEFPDLSRSPQATPTPEQAEEEVGNRLHLEPEPDEFAIKLKPSQLEVKQEAPANPEAKSVKEILTMQEEAFSARREMMKFRHGKKVADLKKADQEHYIDLHGKQYLLRQLWLDELDKLPEDQQNDLRGLTKLQEVRDRLAAMTPEQVVTQALEGTLEAYKEELATLEAEIQEQERLIQYDQNIGDSKVHNITARGNEDDLKALKARRKALIAKIASMSAEQTPTTPEPIPPSPEPIVPPAPPVRPAPEVVPPVPPTTAETAPRPILDYERARAEAKARRLELLRESINAIDRKILEKVEEHSKTSTWSGVMDRMRINREISALKAERVRLHREMNERPGFGAKFKEAATKAYRSVKNRLKFERSQPVGIGDLRGVKEATAPSVDDIARVEAEAANNSGEQVEETGTWGKWLKQRLVGVGTVGWTEFRPAEKFRTGTKDVSKDFGSMSRVVESERDLSQETAHEEANRIMAKIRVEGGESAGDRRFLEISAEITEQRIARNNAKIDEIVLVQMDQLEQKLKGYKGDMGQDVLTAENKGKIATEMRARLVAMRSGESELDVKGMATELRKGLDSKFWRRYVYAGVDAVLWGLAINYIGGWLLSSKAKEVVVAKGVAVGSKEATEATMGVLKTTIWAEAKRQLIAHGVANPTNGQVLQVATKFCVDSGVKVMANGHLIWAKTVAGKAIDTALAKGFMIHEAGGLKLIAGMVAGV